MSPTLKKLALAVCLTGACVASYAQQAAAPAAPPAYGPAISLDMAKKAMAGAEAEAKKNGWPVAISIVDSAGQLVMFQRLENTQYGSIDIATGKAVTSVNFRRPSKALEDAITGGGAGLRLLAVSGLTPLEGGVPIMADGKIIGGIGVSGVTSAQDAQVARAGSDALK